MDIKPNTDKVNETSQYTEFLKQLKYHGIHSSKDNLSEIKENRQELMKKIKIFSKSTAVVCL